MDISALCAHLGKTVVRVDPTRQLHRVRICLRELLRSPTQVELGLLILN